MMVEYLKSLLQAMGVNDMVEVKVGKKKVKKQKVTHNPEHEMRIRASIYFYSTTTPYKYERPVMKVEKCINYEEDIPPFDIDDDISEDIHDDDYEDSDDEFIEDGKVKLRPYQEKIVDSGESIIRSKGFVYLAMEVRTGKTLCALSICNRILPVGSNVLFLTKKKAISSIQRDYDLLSPLYYITIINYESIHKLPDTKWDIVICDEAHTCSAFPKPSKRTKQLAVLFGRHNPKVILLSGTPTPESYSQMYHQVYSIPGNPFAHCRNFYRFCDEYVDVKTKLINSMPIKDYSRGKESIVRAMDPFTIRFTQAEAGFTSTINETILHVKMKNKTYEIADLLRKEKVVTGKEEVILADTSVKLMTKLHQIYSGTVKFESGKAMTIDTSKAEFIFNRYNHKKIGIFYKFTEELSVLKQVFGDRLTTDLDEFDSTDKHIALQIVSGREGISLKKADYLVYYNIDFSATSYWQSRDRMTTIDRPSNDIIWVFTDGGIEDKIYKMVTKKKDYTINQFKKDFNLK